MTSTPTLVLTEGSRPDTGETIPDETPVIDTGDFNPEYPGSTEEAPYGYFPDGRIRKRRPRGHGSRGAAPASRMPASDKQARSAAALLGRLNHLVSLALMTSNLPETAQAIQEANEQFETMAYEALLTDPQLCRKILGAGSTGGKTGLIMAYGMLGLSAVPSARTEIRRIREAHETAA